MSLDRDAVASTRSRRGVILLSVAWCILILTLLLASRVGREELAFIRERTAKGDLSLRLAARSAEAMILAAMAADVSGDPKTAVDAFSDGWGWLKLSTQFRDDLAQAWPDVALEVSIEDEQSKINPRKAQPETIAKLLETNGWPDKEARTTAQMMCDTVRKTAESGAGTQGQNADAQSQAEVFVDLRCLLAVPGISAPLLYGEDMNFNGRLDPNENDGDESLPQDDHNGALRAGLLRYLSTFGDGKVNPNMAPVEILQTVPGVSKKIAGEIAKRRQGADEVLGTDDDFVFKQSADVKKLTSISKFLELEMRKMSPHLRMRTDVFQIRICGVNSQTGQILRRQIVVRREKQTLRVISQLEDNAA